jgi:hypothetical protein
MAAELPAPHTVADPLLPPAEAGSAKSCNRSTPRGPGSEATGAGSGGNGAIGPWWAERRARLQGGAGLRTRDDQSQCHACGTNPTRYAGMAPILEPATHNGEVWVGSLGNKVWGGSGRVCGVGGVHVGKSVDPTDHLPACRVASAENSSVWLCRFNLQTPGADTSNNA